MTRLTIFAVALAAGLTPFAASAESGNFDRMVQEQRLAVEKAKEREAKAKDRVEVDPVTTQALPGRAAQDAGATGRGRKKITLKTREGVIEEKETKTAAVSTGGSYGTLVAKYAASNGVPVSLATAVIRVESNFRPNARGSAGEIGLMQIKPSTARMMGYSGSLKGLYHPETNIKYGMKYLGMAHKLGGGTTCGTILKYNAGHGARRMNKVSAAYCAKVKRQIGA